MHTNIDIDEKLLAKAQKLTGLRTKEEVVDYALRGNLLELAGQIKFYEGFDLKALRAGRGFSDRYVRFVLRRRGLTIRNSIDCCIAQIALDADCTLLHNDRDFRVIAQIRPLREIGFMI